MRNITHEIREYLTYCKNQKRLSNNTMRAYNIDMKQFIAYLYENKIDKLSAKEITKDILRAFVERLQLHYAIDLQTKSSMCESLFQFLRARRCYCY